MLPYRRTVSIIAITVALLYPIESVWPAFIPANQGATAEPAARRVESVFDGVSSALYGTNRDFAYVDSQALCEAKVVGDTLTLGDLRWRVLVLPAANTLPLEAWENVATFWRNGGVVSMTCEPLPVASKPAASPGKYVKYELTGDDASGWHAAATLTEGQVDTFLFMNFTYAEPLNLTACEGLAIDASVPRGQHTATELLVFLHTADGARFLAGTGQYLNEPDSTRTYTMFSQFKPFGQTQGELDLSKIASISIGWGGYLGTAGERITFTVKPPQRFVCGGK